MYRTRKKRKLVIFSLLGVLLLMSVGYAAFQTSFQIKGSTQITSNWDVEITNISDPVLTGSAQSVSKTIGEDKLSASMEADLFDKGDSAEYIVTIENKGTIDAKLEDVIGSSSNSEAVLITFSGYTKGERLYKNGQEGSVKQIHVKIEYNPSYTGGEATGESNIQFTYNQAEGGTIEPKNTYLLTYDYKTNGGEDSEARDEYLDEGSNVDLTKTAIKNGWTFIGWNTNSKATTGLSSLSMPATDITLYAIYGKTVTVTYDKEPGIDKIGKNIDTCTMYNKSSSCSVSLPSISAFDNYVVDGWYDSTMKVGDANDVYNESNDVTLTARVQKASEYVISFDANEGSVLDTTKNVSRGKKIGELPVPTKDNSTFGGWYTSLIGGEEVAEDYVPTDDMTVYARWFSAETVAVIDDIGYNTLSEAINAVQADGNPKTIKLLKDVEEYNTVGKNKNIIIDLNKHKVSVSTANRMFTNDGTLEIKNGNMIMTGSSKNVIYNNSVMKIRKCNITSSAASGAVDNNPGANLEIIDTKIEMTGSRQAVYNDGGTLKIKGNTYLSNVKDRAALHNLNNGTVTIESGKIVSTSTIGGIYNQSGRVIIGVKNGIVSYNNLVIQSSSYAVATNGNIYLYDGILKGMTAAIDNESNIAEIEDETEKIFDSETISGDTYNTLFLHPIGERHTVIFNPNGGEVVPQKQYVINGQTMAELPTPTRYLYNFIGWYTGLSSGIEVTTNYAVENDMTVYAKWQKRPSYAVRFETNGGNEVDDIELEQGDKIEKLPKPYKTGLVFDGWYLDDTLQTKVNDGFTPTGNATLYAKWVESTFSKVFEQSGECTFNGSDSNITGSECQKYADKNYIDTGISLYSSENKDKDYEISFEIVSFVPNDNIFQATLFNTKLEANGYPGLVVRKRESNSLEIASRKTSTANESITLDASNVNKISIYRINGEIYYSINDQDMVFSNNLTEYNPTFDMTAWFGAAPVDETCLTTQRHFKGKLKNMYIKLGTYQGEVKYKITYNVNGGNQLSPDYKKVSYGDFIGELPEPTREGYIFNGWYTSISSGIKVTSNYVPNSDMTVYASWRKITE